MAILVSVQVEHETGSFGVEAQVQSGSELPFHFSTVNKVCTVQQSCKSPYCCDNPEQNLLKKLQNICTIDLKYSSMTYRPWTFSSFALNFAY